MPRPFRIGIPVDPSTGSAVLHASSSLGPRQDPDQNNDQGSQNPHELENNAIAQAQSSGGGGDNTNATAMVRFMPSLLSSGQGAQM
jgi:hypothetical protein